MKYFGTFIFTHHPSTCRARRGKRTRGTARIKQLNETKTEMLPIIYRGAFFSPIYLYRIIRSTNVYLEMSKKLFIFASTKRNEDVFIIEKKQNKRLIPIKKKRNIWK